VILFGGGVVMIVRRRGPGVLPWAFAGTILLVPPMVADFDLRYLVPAMPAACLAAALAFAPRSARSGQRRCATSPAATRTSAPGPSGPAGAETRTSSLPSGSTPAASPESS